MSATTTAKPEHAEFADLHESGQDFGDFYPTGHVLAAFPDRDTAQAARKALLAEGWSEAECRYFDDQTVQAGAQRGLETATLLSSLGSTLKMVELHRDLAAKGCHFLLIKTADDAHCAHMMTVLGGFSVSLAQRYQRLAIETLIQNDPLTGRQK